MKKEIDDFRLSREEKCFNGNTMIAYYTNKFDEELIIEYKLNGIIVSKIYKNKIGYNNYKNKPACTIYDQDGGELKTETYYINGENKRLDDGPVKIEYYPNGRVCEETYLSKNQKNKKIIITYYKDGQILSRTTYINDLIDSDDESPSAISYNKDGTIFYKGYYKLNRLHKTDGPAFIYYDPNGSCTKEYYLNGKEYNEFEYLVKIGTKDN